jgi:hypothetical protein
VARATARTPAPWSSSDAARGAMFAGAQSGWTVVPGDDPDHALLVMRRTGGTAGAQLFLLESGRPPASVQAPPTAFDAIDAAARLGGRWYVATAARPPDPPAAVVWTLDGTHARELTRLPRVGLDTHPQVFLGRRGDGPAIGIAVEGQPDVRRAPSIWMTAFDADSGELSEPTALASLDSPTTVCSGEAMAAPDALSKASLSRAPAHSGELATLATTVYSAKRLFHLRCAPQ